MAFRTKRMLEPHLRSHTNAYVLVVSITCRESPHRCEVPGCGKVFAYRSGLMAHIKHVHDQRHPCRCPEKNCRMQFATNSLLQEHYERAHKLKLPDSHAFGELGYPRDLGVDFWSVCCAIKIILLQRKKRRGGIEPSTSQSAIVCSTTELSAHLKYLHFISIKED